MDIIKNIIRGKKLADKMFGFESAIIDLLFYLLVLGIGWVSGYGKASVILVLIFVVTGLWLAYKNGKQGEYE